ncbi:type IV pilus modification protein PilV [Variovorax sp. J22R133]|uniref:type IV pilus modification protein PilV n=1 Tax=Variovorax brevis TaxID=3053503 RepID=UPI0025782737|nr:type IV pilus modification protein PilV [Variovorax sp. J22R133]MDM0115278.1 type IV pilus modification protein PilV [Variovorax sp. J22R133]
MITKLHTQAGATLIEALVALLIFSIGMVGIAGLMSSAIKYQTGNEARFNVSAALNDLSERLRVNVAGANGFAAVVGGVTTKATGYQLSSTYTAQVSAVPSTPTVDCASASCTPAQMADYDIAHWKNLLRATLPGGAGYIVGDVVKGFDVSVMWADKSAVDASDTLIAARSCNAADSDTSGKARFCCPSDAEVPDGVRCYTARIVP